MEKYVLKTDFAGGVSDLAAERRRADTEIRGVRFSWGIQAGCKRYSEQLSEIHTSFLI